MLTNKRLFFAFWPSEKQRQTIESAIAHHKTELTGKRISRDNWHVTLVFIGNFPEKNIAGIKSEFLVLGAIEEDGKVVLLHPSQPAKNGLKIA